jgi:hippurate hydrolase
LKASAVPLLLLALAGGASAQSAAPLKAQVASRVDGMYPWLEGVYQDLHAHPEIAFQEVRTADKLAQAMRKLGFDVTEKVGGTGPLALLRNGAGPTVLVRTELDGLPMEEKTGLPYASRDHTRDGAAFTAHSCGHDVHMAAWLGAARTLVELKQAWHGTLMFIAQPAEETVSGARAMLEDGLFKRFPKPDYAFALHSWPLANGTVGFESGPVSSNSDALEIRFNGRGGHGSAPDKTIDPVMMAARFVVDLQSVISREKDPQEFGVVSIGAIQGGSAENIIPDSVTLRGTIRSYKPAVRQKMLDGIRRTAKAVT